MTPGGNTGRDPCGQTVGWQILAACVLAVLSSGSADGGQKNAPRIRGESSGPGGSETQGRGSLTGLAHPGRWVSRSDAVACIRGLRTRDAAKVARAKAILFGWDSFDEIQTNGEGGGSLCLAAPSCCGGHSASHHGWSHCQRTGCLLWERTLCATVFRPGLHVRHPGAGRTHEARRTPERAAPKGRAKRVTQ